MGVRRLATVSNDVHPSKHLTNSEEANDLSGGDTGKGQLLRASVADTGEKSRRGGEGLESGRVVDEGLEVGLESGQVANKTLLDREVRRWDVGIDLRGSHVLATEDQLAKLKADLGVVQSRGDHGWIDG